MRAAILICGLSSSLLALPLRAQTAADSTTRATRPAPALVPTRQDSIQAIQHLFQGRRRTGTWFIVGGTTALTTIGLLYAATSAFSSILNAPYALTNQTAPKEDYTGFALAAGVVGAGTVVPAISLKGSFSRGREKALIEAYEQGKPLPAEIRNALKPKFFRRSR